MNARRTHTPRRTGIVLVLTAAVVAGAALPIAATAIAQPVGAPRVTTTFWGTATETESVTILERPSYVNPWASADNAERIIRRELERRRAIVEELKGMPADRIERELLNYRG